MPSLSPTQLHTLVRDVYLAAGNARHWPVFLESYRQAFDAACATFMFWDRTGTSANSFAAGPEADAIVRQYNEYYGRLNPHPMQDVGTVSLGQQGYPIDRLHRTEYYNDYLCRFDIDCVLGLWLDELQGTAAQVSCLRPLRVGLFGEEEVRYARCLLPHVQRALQIHTRLSGVTLDRDSAAAGLDVLTTGVLIVDRTTRIQFANVAARRLLVAGDGLVSDAAGLRATAPSETRALRSVVAAAAGSDRGNIVRAGGVLRISRPDARQPLSVLVAPLSQTPAYPRLPPGCVMVLVDVPAPLRDGRTLASLYGLTPVEAALSTRLLAGETVQASAEAMAIGDATLRTHLKAIFEKTRTRGQADFVRVATASLADRTASGPRTSSQPPGRPRRPATSR